MQLKKQIHDLYNVIV